MRSSVLAMVGALALAACKEQPRPRDTPPLPRPTPDHSTSPAVAMLTLSDLVTRAARSQLSMPDGVTSEPRTFLAHRVADLWAVNVDGARRQGIAVFYVPGGAIAPPLGLAEAGRRLVAMNVFRDPDWKGGLFYPVLAAGGMTPGLPDYPTFSDRVTAAGELELVLDLDEPAVRYAARGGLGPPPSTGSGGGRAAPARKGQAIFTITRSGAIRWVYTVEGTEIGRFASPPASAPAPLDAALVIDLLERARAQVGAPRGVLATPPRPLGAGALGELYRVELLGIGPVHVDRRRPARGTDLAAARARLGGLGAAITGLAPADLLAVLEAIGGLPPGLIAADLAPAATQPPGQLEADLAGPLAHWSAGGAQGPSPRWPGFTPPPSWNVAARARFDRGAMRWSLEVRAGDRYVPLKTSW